MAVKPMSKKPLKVFGPKARDKHGWIGVDLDGTLAHYDGKWRGVAHIGPPIKPMADRVKQWLKEGRQVKIFTARMDGFGKAETAAEAKHHIEKWCLKHFGKKLEVTNVKDGNMTQLWDDRAVQIKRNEGHPVGHEYLERLKAAARMARLQTRRANALQAAMESSAPHLFDTRKGK